MNYRLFCQISVYLFVLGALLTTGAGVHAEATTDDPAPESPPNPHALNAPSQDADELEMPPKSRNEGMPPAIMVEIQGAVDNPGVYRFDQGDRLHDALLRAGGPAQNAEIRDLNIAARLIDGSVLTIPFRQLPSGPREPTAAQLNPAEYTRSGWKPTKNNTVAARGNTTSTDKCTDLNTADSSELEALPGVGPKTAAKILRFREQQPFQSVEDLRMIQGIGDKRLETLRGLVCVR